MIRTVLTAAAATIALAPAAFAETRNVTGFHSVHAASRVEVEIRQGANFSVSLEGPDAAETTTRVSNGTLHIEPPRRWFSSRRDTQVRITMPEIRGIAAAAGSEVEALDIRAQELSLDASSGAELTVSGTCTALNADASSGADLDASALRCATANVDASSGADAHVNASQSVNVDASSGSDIYLTGGASITAMDTSSGADVHRR